MDEQIDVVAVGPEPATDLRATVWALADADESLADGAKLAILEALGEHEVAGSGSAVASTDQGSVYLKSISVKGFRGVGTEVRVPLRPGPGLVVISGRNGSGKSTIAEAMELALTGNSYRWRNRTAVWSQNWRNLHSGHEASIRLDLAMQDAGPVTIGVDWATDAELEPPPRWAQRQGGKREPGSDPLGWAAPLELYRPLLSYEELGGVLDGQPKDLYDKLNVLLGLDRITGGQQRAAAADRAGQEPAGAAAGPQGTHRPGQGGGCRGRRRPGAAGVGSAGQVQEGHPRGRGPGRRHG